MISQGPELVMNNLRTLFNGLKNLCLENSAFPRGLSGDFWESGERTFMSWFGLTRRGCWPSHQANLPRLTDSVLEHWYKKLYPHPHGPCGMGTHWFQENPLGTPWRRSSDDLPWDPMDLVAKGAWCPARLSAMAAVLSINNTVEKPVTCVQYETMVLRKCGSG